MADSRRSVKAQARALSKRSGMPYTAALRQITGGKGHRPKEPESSLAEVLYQSGRSHPDGSWCVGSDVDTNAIVFSNMLGRGMTRCVMKPEPSQALWEIMSQQAHLVDSSRRDVDLVMLDSEPLSVVVDTVIGRAEQLLDSGLSPTLLLMARDLPTVERVAMKKNSSVATLYRQALITFAEDGAELGGHLVCMMSELIRIPEVELSDAVRIVGDGRDRGFGDAHEVLLTTARAEVPRRVRLLNPDL